MSYRFFENKSCEYYPCHEGLKEINCLFCFCPLYSLGEHCGGNFVMTNGIKDCSGCTYPHKPEHYEAICRRLSRK